MVSSQLVDNQVVGNYYRNNEAFVNAESGIHFALSQLALPTTTDPLPTGLPVIYERRAHADFIEVSLPTDLSSVVEGVQFTQVTMIESSNGVQITSRGTSVDGSAKKVMTLEVEPYFNFPIPTAAISSNGKLNLGTNVSVINGCETSDDCLASGNVAENSLLTNPENEGNDYFCSGGSIRENVIADNILKGNKSVKTIAPISGIADYDWGEATYPDGTEVFGITANTDLNSRSLFEKTFGMEMTQTNLDALRSSAVEVNEASTENCNDTLAGLDDTNSFVFIKGNCHLSSYTEVVIGTAEHPKLVIIEGGIFDTPVSIVGMLYFLPETDTDGALIDTDINLNNIDVTGALLTEHKCSQSAVNPLSVRYDKTVLEKLYASLDIEMLASGYQLVVGTWKDFE